MRKDISVKAERKRFKRDKRREKIRMRRNRAEKKSFTDISNENKNSKTKYT